MLDPYAQAQIRARHVATAISRLSANTGMDLADPERTWCKSDMQRWPCDTATLLAALDEARAEIRHVAEYVTLYNGTVKERDVARADSKRLAEAFDRLAADWHRRLHGPLDWRGCTADACVANQHLLAAAILSDPEPPK